MKLYLAWWETWEVHEGVAKGLLGIYSTLDKADSVCKLYLVEDDDEDGVSSFVTVLELDSEDNQYHALNGFYPVSKFTRSLIEE